MNYTNSLYGRRILHVMSPVRWRSTKFMHQADSNYKVMMKTIKWLPDCHHFVLVPQNNTIPPMGDNVTIIPKFKFTPMGTKLHCPSILVLIFVFSKDNLLISHPNSENF